MTVRELSAVSAAGTHSKTVGRVHCTARMALTLGLSHVREELPPKLQETTWAPLEQLGCEWSNLVGQSTHCAAAMRSASDAEPSQVKALAWIHVAFGAIPV